MSIKLRKKPAALVAIPDGSYVQLFVDEDGLPKLKDSVGDITQLSQSAVVTLVEQGSDPTPTANQLKIYSKDVAGNTEMFVVDSSGNEIQVTDDGTVAGGGAASAIATSGTPVAITPTPPVTYQSLVAVDATTSVWFYPFAGALLSGGGTNTIDISSSPDPVSGQTLVATGSGSATWQTTGLTQDLTVHHSGFTAVRNTVHYVAIGDAVAKTVSIPTLSLADGDIIEIVAIGSGSDEITINPNGNNINWGGFALSLPWSLSGAGLHVKLRWSTDVWEQPEPVRERGFVLGSQWTGCH
jgi:hypothetical protein